VLAELAARQHGVVAMFQLEALGYSRWAVWRLVEAKQLHRLYRGVYAVGHTRLSMRGRWMAAVLACGPEAVLSHHAAAALWELRPAPSTIIDITAPGKRKHAGIRCHVALNLPNQDRTQIDGIPVTSLYRTLLDQAGTLNPQRLRSVVEAAERRDLLDARTLDSFLARSQGHRGQTPLRAVIGSLTDEAPWTQSELERRFLELIRAAGLPEPRCNVLVAGELVDFYWPAQRLVVEVDGYRFHKTRRSFEDDRRKDLRLQLAGCRAVRITARRIQYEPGRLTAELHRLIGSAPPR
jgi:very-short-patch-repair endonuclease